MLCIHNTDTVHLHLRPKFYFWLMCCLLEIMACDISLNEEDAIGTGGQASVFKAFWKVKQIPVAVKKIGVLSNAAKREVC